MSILEIILKERIINTTYSLIIKGKLIEHEIRKYPHIKRGTGPLVVVGTIKVFIEV